MQFAWSCRGDRWFRASLAVGFATSAVVAVRAAWFLTGGAIETLTLMIPRASAVDPSFAIALEEDPLSTFFVLVVAVSGSAILLASIDNFGNYVPERGAIPAVKSRGEHGHRTPRLTPENTNDARVVSKKGFAARTRRTVEYTRQAEERASELLEDG